MGGFCLCIFFLISASLFCGGYSPSWVSLCIMGLPLDLPEHVHSRPCLWSLCMTTNLMMQPYFSSSGMHGPKTFLPRQYYAPASHSCLRKISLFACKFIYDLNEVYKIFWAHIGAWQVLIFLVHPNIENKRPGTFL